MADSGLFIGWGQVVRGREGPAVDSFNEFVEFVGQLQSDGRIEDFEIVFLDPHGGDLGGFMLMRGSTAQLDAVRSDDEFVRHMLRADLLVDGLGIVGAALNERVARQMAVFQEEIGALA
jgi:hypothetical protein